MVRRVAASFLLAAALPAWEAAPTTVEIAPGVHMPYVNLGGVHSLPSNYSAWLELGGTGLDTALMYGDDVQVSVGDAVLASGAPRDKLFITSKVPCCPENRRFNSGWCDWYGKKYDYLSAHTYAKIDARLLGLEVIDLVLLHWPCDTMEQTLATYRSLEEFALAGRARAIGVSNFNATMIEALLAAGLRVPPVVNQCGFSIGGHNRSACGSDFGTLAKCKEHNITYSAYSPLGGITQIDVINNPTVKSIGQRYGKSSAQVALRWLTQQGIVVVTASEKLSHLKPDLEIFDFDLADEEMLALREIGDGPQRAQIVA